MLEVEVRGPLTEDEYRKLDNFLESNAEKIRDFDEFAVFYHSGDKHNFPIGALRIKKDDKSEKIVFKVFDVGAQEINDELEINLKPDEYKKAVKLFHHLGIEKGDVAPCYRKDFKYKDMTISIKDKHMLGPHFEVEKRVSEDQASTARNEIAEFCKTMELRIWEGDDYSNHRDRVLKEVGGPVNVLEHLQS